MTQRIMLVDLAPATFELEQTSATHWVVRHAEAPKGNKSNVEQFVGLEYQAGDNPDWRPTGYAQRIQRALNNWTVNHANQT